MKKTVLALLAVIIVVGFTACGEKKEAPAAPPATPEVEAPAEQEPTKEPETKAPAEGKLDIIAVTIKDSVEMKDGMTPITTERNAENAYPGISELAEEFAIHINATGGYAEEIAVIKGKEGVDMAKLEELAGARVAFQKENFVDYRPDEMVKLNSPVIETFPEDNMIVIVIADDQDAARAAITKAVA